MTQRESGMLSKMPVMLAILALTTAGFGVLSAYLGYQTAELGRQQKELEVQAQRSGAEATALQQENQKLQDENGELQSRLTDSAPPAAPPAATLNLPEAFIGDWQGVVSPVPGSERSDKTEYPLRISLQGGRVGDKVGFLSVPTECSADNYFDVTLRSVNGTSAAYDVQTAGCSRFGNLRLTVGEAGTLVCETFLGDDAVGRSTLTK